MLGYTAEDSDNKSSDPARGALQSILPHARRGLGVCDQRRQSPDQHRPDAARWHTAVYGWLGSPVVINADNLTGCDFVRVDELSGPTTFDITGTPVDGQFVSLSIYTSMAQAITWTTGAGKFSAENGLALPTFTDAAGYVLWGFRYNAFSSRWAFVATTQPTTTRARRR